MSVHLSGNLMVGGALCTPGLAVFCSTVTACYLQRFTAVVGLAFALALALALGFSVAQH